MKEFIMSQQLDSNLVELAYEIVNLKGKEKEIKFGGCSDYQGDLSLSWYNGKFIANLVVFSNPYTSGYGSYFDPPETTWDEEEVDFESVKIKAVADWLKSDWRFKL